MEVEIKLTTQLTKKKSAKKGEVKVGTKKGVHGTYK